MVEVFPTASAVAETEWKPLIKQIVRVTRDVLHRNATTGPWRGTSEVAYFVANSATSARQAATAIRGHWHIENTLHYIRDVTFREDHSRIRHNPGAQPHFSLQPGAPCCRSWRPRCATQVVLQLKALNSPVKGLAEAEVRIEQVYTTADRHHNQMDLASSLHAT